MKIEKMTKISKDDSEKIFQLYCKYSDTLDQKEIIEMQGTERELAQESIGNFLTWLDGETDAAKYADDYADEDVADLMSALDGDHIHSEQDYQNEKTTWYFDDGSFIEISGTDIKTGWN